MLVDAFADMKTGRRIIEKISEKNRSLADRLAELTKKYSSESVEKLIQDFSPAGRKNKNYGREILQEVRSCGR